jgi:hypothetical protein
MPSLSYIYPHRCAKIYSWRGYEIHLESGLAYGEKFFQKFSGSKRAFKKLNFGVGFLFTSETWAYVSCTFSFLLAAVFVRLLYSPERLSSFFSVLTKERRLTRGSCMLSLGWRLNTYICIIRKAACSVRCCCASPPPPHQCFISLFFLYFPRVGLSLSLSRISRSLKSLEACDVVSLFSHSLSDLFLYRHYTNNKINIGFSFSPFFDLTRWCAA